MFMTQTLSAFEILSAHFGDAVKEHVSLAPYTSARIGGPADVLITVKSKDELANVVEIIWDNNINYTILGGGSNVLVSDKGFRGVVVLNRAKEVKFGFGDQPQVWCEAGVVISNLSRRCIDKGLSGLEWACTVPGTVGGAVYGNAGAYDGDISQTLIWAEVMTGNGIEKFSVEQMQYAYRSSVMKRNEIKMVVLSALLGLKNASSEEVSVKINQFSERRKASQPPGASMGSMFKNPDGDYAGRLIEAAGLKGKRIGNAEISTVHGNFFVNHGETKASDVRALIDLTRQTVKEKFGVELELEVEMIGDW
ncbi:MAG: UDP-N-acetylenolpyruvoylglucosamine reductase [Chloroflexi bacterium OLB14]|nr:MAG: UDP-N-acetylenolpyruvoylglucosamine reductase [Chloroflexi bacterium OLB14]